MRCGHRYNFFSLQIHPEEDPGPDAPLLVEDRDLPAPRHQAKGTLPLVQRQLSPAGSGPRAKSVVLAKQVALGSARWRVSPASRGFIARSRACLRSRHPR